MNTSVWKKMNYWKIKYNSTPNGWAVASLIGAEYQGVASRVSKSKRKKLKKRRR